MGDRGGGGGRGLRKGRKRGRGVGFGVTERGKRGGGGFEVGGGKVDVYCIWSC